jgi:hypothetical protein
MTTDASTRHLYDRWQAEVRSGGSMAAAHERDFARAAVAIVAREMRGATEPTPTDPRDERIRVLEAALAASESLRDETTVENSRLREALAPFTCDEATRATELGDLPDMLAAHSAALLACDVARVRDGKAGIVGVLGPWRDALGLAGDGVYHRACSTGGIGSYYRDRTWVGSIQPGWGARNSVGWTDGPETGDAGRDAADRAALASGFALLGADGSIALP